ncbi:MAG: hypothetical protein AAF585_08235 [Verrucomicrobiota bacterium]
MSTIAASPIDIVRGKTDSCLGWLRPAEFSSHAGVAAAIIVIGCGLYGGAIGSWRDPMMGVYVGIKFPMMIFLTLLANGMINGMIAAAIGSGLGFRESVQSQLMSFMIFALMLGSLSPIAFGMAWNAPEPDSPQRQQAHDLQLLIHTVVIAYAGIISNYKLFHMLRAKTGSRSLAMKTMFCWLAGNLFVGAQVAYVMRPFFGTPGLPVEFMREDAFNSNFYEAILQTINRTLT